MKVPLPPGLALLAGLLFGFPAALFAQLPLPSVTPLPTPSPLPRIRTDGSLQAAITYGAGQVMIPGSFNGVTNRVGLDPNQVVTITLQFPVTKIGQPLNIQPLDGGIIIPGSALGLSPTGTLQFQFQANQEPGLTQIRVRLGTDEYGLQFYVFDPRHPKRNPRIPKATARRSDPILRTPVEDGGREP